MLTTRNGGAIEGTPSRRQDARVIQEKDTGWYQAWYFDLRLEEELARAKRYGLHLSILTIFLDQTMNDRRDRRLLNELLADMAERKLRQTDIPGVLSAGQFAVLLTHTNPSQSEVVAHRLQKWFEPYVVRTGIASYPEDSEVTGHLLMVAKHRALAPANEDVGVLEAL